MQTTLFTSAAVLDLLSQIDELKDKDIFLSETSDGFKVTVGNSTYNIKPENPVDVEVTEEVIDEVEDAKIDTLSEMDAAGEISLEEHEFDELPVEGGPIKELIKTLFVGGLVRMGSKAAGKDMLDGAVAQADKYRRRR